MPRAPYQLWKPDTLPSLVSSSPRNTCSKPVCMAMCVHIGLRLNMHGVLHPCSIKAPTTPVNACRSLSILLAHALTAGVVLPVTAVEREPAVQMKHL